LRVAEAVARLAGLPFDRKDAPSGGWPAFPEWLRPVRTDGGVIPDRPPQDLDACPAAVLVCLWPGDDGSAFVLLTERPSYDGAHSGQVSFPGGREEPADAGDPVATAIREAREEVGLDPDACGLDVLGLLETTWIPTSNFVVTPVVAVAARALSLVPDPREVAAILHAPVQAFLPGGPRTAAEATINAWPLRYGAFAVEGRMVWGATARILAQLGELLAR
jgi:8-oxo-dGTP pyrophosphatase MutT (NUDIX family)